MKASSNRETVSNAAPESAAHRLTPTIKEDFVRGPPGSWNRRG